MPDDDFELDSNASPTNKESTLDEDQITSNVAALDISDTIYQSQEATRAKIAWVFTQLFLALIMFALILPTVIDIFFPYVFANPLDTTKELVTLIASVLAGPFGFIVGFYFKEHEA
jgi:hypothetical protein